MDSSLKDSSQNEKLQYFEETLQELLEHFEHSEEDPVRGRPRILSAFCLWSSVLFGVLRGFSSQLQLWKLLTFKSFWKFRAVNLSDQAVYKRLSQESDFLQSFFEYTTESLQQRLQPHSLCLASWANGVYAIDASVLDKIKRYLPSLCETPRKDNKDLLPGRIHAAFDLNLQQWTHVLKQENPDQNEKVTAWELIEKLPKQSLLLFDLGYFSFEFFDRLADENYFCITRLRKKTSYTELHTFCESGDFSDKLVFLGKTNYRSARAVRMIRFSIGSTNYEYITNVLEPERLSLPEIAGLYQRRWDIELAFKLLKREMNLHFFWSAKPEVIWHQVWASLAISQIVLGFRQELAGRIGVDPFEISMKSVVEDIPDFVMRGIDFYERFAELGRKVGVIRPSRRVENRAPSPKLSKYNLDISGVLLERSPRYPGV